MTKILYIPKVEGQLEYTLNNGIMCVMRTYCKILGNKYHEDDKAFWCKTPDRLGDITLVEDFYKEYPQIITTEKDLYDENEACNYYLKTLGGSKLGVGYGLVTELCDLNYVKYHIFDIE